MGLIAQEVEETFPEVVSEDQEGYKSLNYGKIVAALVEGMTAQQKQIERLIIQNEKLQVRIEALESR